MYDGKPILLIEDERASGPTVRAALGELGVSHGVVHVSNAEEALAFLRAEAPQMPSIIFLDGSREETSGLDVLRAVKHDEKLKSIPVITLAPSGDAKIINQSFELGAAGYVVKSDNHKDFVEAVRAVHQYWMLSEVPVGA